jgi:uncharacterized membrane protein YkvA (DUF1232 family)
VQGWARRLKQEIIALTLAYRDPRTPWYARAFAALVIAYAVSPIDLVPDFVPLLGYLDDLILVPLGVALALRMIPPSVMAEAREKAARHLANEGERWMNRTGTAMVIGIWLALAAAGVLWMVRLIGAWRGG